MAGKRRGNAEGSITLYKGKDGKPDRWVARLTLPDGRRKALYAKTRQEAARKLTAALRARDTGLTASGDERQTFGRFLAAWLETIRPAVKPKTFTRYELAVRIHITPALGTVKLAKLSAHQLQTLYGAKLSAGLAAGTVAHLHAVIHRALDHAERLDLVPRNVADRVTAPRPAHHEMRIFSQEQAQTLLRGVEGDALEAAYVLALTIGLRQGELLALRWRDVNFDTATLRIEHTLHFDKGGVWRLASPKTERSRRTVELPPMAIDALRTHRRRQIADRLAMGDVWQDHDFVFCSAIGEPLRGTHLLERHFLPLLKELGLPKARWHDLRHTCVSLAIAQGVQVNMISQMIGHSSTSMTSDVYAHILPGMGKAAALAMEHALRGSEQVG